MLEGKTLVKGTWQVSDVRGVSRANLYCVTPEKAEPPREQVPNASCMPLKNSDYGKYLQVIMISCCRMYLRNPHLSSRGTAS